MRGRFRTGFTLVELLVVIIIVAVVAAIAVPKITVSRQKAREAALRQNLKIARMAVERFYADTGCYPQRMSWLNDTINEVTPTFPALKPDGTAVTLNASVYQGPYYPDSAGNGTFTAQPNPLGGTYTHGGLRIIMDPISRLPFNCQLSGGQFRVWSSAAGNDSNGVAYSSY